MQFIHTNSAKDIKILILQLEFIPVELTSLLSNKIMHLFKNISKNCKFKHLKSKINLLLSDNVDLITTVSTTHLNNNNSKYFPFTSTWQKSINYLCTFTIETLETISLISSRKIDIDFLQGLYILLRELFKKSNKLLNLTFISESMDVAWKLRKTLTLSSRFLLIESCWKQIHLIVKSELPMQVQSTWRTNYQQRTKGQMTIFWKEEMSLVKFCKY